MVAARNIRAQGEVWPSMSAIAYDRYGGPDVQRIVELQGQEV